MSLWVALEIFGAVQLERFVGTTEMSTSAHKVYTRKSVMI